MSFVITVASGDRRVPALRLLFSRFPAEEQSARLEEALRSVERGSLNLDMLLLAEAGDMPIGAALMMPQADGVALVWPPVISCQADDVESVERGLMQRLCQEMDEIGTKFAQCLLAPDDTVESTLLERYGFEHATDMFFLARSLTASDREMGPIANDLDHQIYDESMSKELGSIIERTYNGSLDCPFFNDTRTGQDAIASHRLSGCFDPAGWRIYRRGSENIGVLMMNEHPDQDAIELVYFGILPEFRGQGLGREVLTDGVHAASLTGRSVLYLAVDCGNIYANALYSELGFVELARRRVMLRRSPQLARK